MTPNLQALFARSANPLYSTVDGVNLVDRDTKLARIRLEDLLATHGEVLVKALEEFVDGFEAKAASAASIDEEPQNDPCFYMPECLAKPYRDVKLLLATLEHDAGGAQ
jgi:hypothetical protein